MAITGFKCGVCGEIFDDPDVCMDHFIREHPDYKREEESDVGPGGGGDGGQPRAV